MKSYAIPEGHLLPDQKAEQKTPSMKKKLVMIGDTSNARLAHSYFAEEGQFEVVAFAVEREYRRQDRFCGLPVTDLEDLHNVFPASEYHAFVAIGYTDMNRVRQRIYEQMKTLGYIMPNYISPFCTWLTSESPGDNNLILEDNTIQPGVKIGNNNVLWSGNHIGHDVQIGDHNYITSHVVISGFTAVSDNCFLGVNASLRDHIRLARATLIGAGSVITKDTGEGDVYVPPRAIKIDKKSHEIKIS